MEPGQADTLQGVLEIPNLDHRELPRLGRLREKYT